MSSAPIVRLAADVAPAQRAMAAGAANIVGSLAATGVAAAAAGRTISADAIRPLQLLATTASVTALSVGRAGAAVGGLAAANPGMILRLVGAIQGLNLAWAAAAAGLGAALVRGNVELRRFQELAERSAAANVGTTYFQSWVKGAEQLRISVAAAQADLTAAERATRDQFDSERADGKSNRALELMQSRFLGTNDFGLSNAPQAFANATNAEERLTALRQYFVDLERNGHQAVAVTDALALGLTNVAERVQTGRTSFAEWAASIDRLRSTGISDGSLVSPELIRRADELKKRWEENSRELDRNMRPILDECARLANAMGHGAAWTAEQFTGLIGVIGRVVAALRTSTAEANALAGAAARAARNSPQVALSPEPALDDGPGQARAAGERGWARVRNSVRGRAERAFAQAERDAADTIQSMVGIPDYPGAAPRIDGSSAPQTTPPPLVRPAAAGAGSAPRAPRAAKEETDEWADAYVKLIQNMEKANAQVAAELATHGRSTEERQRALDIAKLEAEARRTGGTVTASQRAETERLATANARLSDSLKQAQADAKGLSDALQYGGDRLVDLVFNSRDLAGLWKGLTTELGRSAITGQGPFAQLLGMAPAAGAPAGTLGGLMGLVQASRGGGGAGGFGAGGVGLLLRLLMGGMGAPAGAPLDLLAFVQHAGGMVGSGPVRSVPASVFANVERFHGGGALRPGERPVIAEMTEEILNKKQIGRTAEALAIAGSASGRMVTNIYQSVPAQVRTEQGDDGSLNIFLEAAESYMAGRISAGRGPVPAAIGGFTGAESNRNMNG
jgi:hypothetical protein